jgi:hypothetical protein
MAMQQTLAQMPLVTRIPALAQGITNIRNQRTALDAQEAELMELLTAAEEELAGTPGGVPGVEPTGLVQPKPPAGSIPTPEGKPLPPPSSAR